MPTVNGVQVPQDAYDYITQNSGNVYLLVDDEASKGECTNCGGIGAVFLTILSPDSKTRSVTTGIDSNGHTVVIPSRTKQWPCPVCTERTFPIIRELLDDCGVLEPERNLNISFLEGAEGREILLEQSRIILSSIHNPSGVYTFFGGHGTGKSCTAKAVVVAAAKAGIKARFCTAEDIVEEMQSVFDPEDKSVQERTKDALIQRYMRYAILAIDEIDRVGLTESGAAFMFRLMNKRYEQRRTLCTIMTINRHPDELPIGMSYLGDRMRDGIRVPVGGQSFRGM